ncbi:MAG: hypothetical protein IT331_15100 [Anaerolineae bacterium]|nr:hypothetical protein [Anaerolineae bacterium]
MTSTTIPVVPQKSETFFERYSWIVFLALGLIIALFGLGDILTGGATFESGEAPTLQGISGMTWQQLSSTSPNAASMIDYLVRAGGLHLFILGLLSMSVAATAFRRGERWAWFAMWLWPLWLGMVVLLLLSVYKQAGPGVPPPLVSGSIFLVITVSALGLSFRKFFPKQQTAVGATVGG